MSTKSGTTPINGGGAERHQKAQKSQYVQPEGLFPVYALLEEVWIFTAILKGIKDKPWEHTQQLPKEALTELRSMHPVTRMWIGAGLLEVTPCEGKENTKVSVQLTGKGEQVIALGGLLEYEYSMIEQHLTDDFVTQPEKYKVLRKALGVYAETQLPAINQWLVDKTPQSAYILDFGGGDGFYLDMLTTMVPSAHGILLDKAPGDKVKNNPDCATVKLDFKQDTKFITDNREAFDVILVSEVLHVLTPAEISSLLHKLASMLKLKGKLIVLEQQPSLRLDWRLCNMTTGGRVLPREELIKLMMETSRYSMNMHEQPTVSTSTHYGVCVTKV